MSLFHSPYQLKPQQQLNAVAGGGVRHGCLLKVVWEDGLIGYADLHPWPELGDAPLEQQLREAQAGHYTTQFSQSLKLARQDAELRHQKKNLFDQGVPVQNNFLLTEPASLHQIQLQEIKKAGFQTVKLKMGVTPAAEMTALQQIAAAGLRLRLDFNARSEWAHFQNFVSRLPCEVRAMIEYVEDPFPFDLTLWNEAHQLLPLAVDNQYEKVPWDLVKTVPFAVIVAKPAKMDMSLAVQRCQAWKLKMTVTSYMDHPLGVVQAMGVAMELKKKYPDMILDSGCLTHSLYQADDFACELKTHGSYLLKVDGLGAGFDKLLEAVPWQKLKID